MPDLHHLNRRVPPLQPPRAPLHARLARQFLQHFPTAADLRQAERAVPRLVVRREQRRVVAGDRVVGQLRQPEVDVRQRPRVRDVQPQRAARRRPPRAVGVRGGRRVDVGAFVCVAFLSVCLLARCNVTADGREGRGGERMVCVCVTYRDISIARPRLRRSRRARRGTRFRSGRR